MVVERSSDAFGHKPHCDWNYSQRLAFVEIVQRLVGYKPTSYSNEYKWKEIRTNLKKNHQFLSCQVPQWRQLYKQYLFFLNETLKKYDISPDEMDYSHLPAESDIPLWEWLMLQMARERFREFFMYPTHESRKTWKKERPGVFFGFIFVSFGLVVFDVILVGFNPASLVYGLQVLVLALSILCFSFGYYNTYFYFPNDYNLSTNHWWYNLLRHCIPYEPALILLVKLQICLDKESIAEIVCYLLGVIYVGSNQRGLATLRIFRIFRYLSYFKYIEKQYENEEVPPHRLFFSPVKAASLCAFYMEQLFQEFATQKSLGGLLVLVFFFFNVYAFAVVFTNERGDLQYNLVDGQVCETLSDCFITMMRLVFYDGTGFNYLQALIDQHRNGGYIFLIFGFVIFNGIILINGLIGIFASTFTTSDEKVVETSKKIEVMEERLAYLHDLISRVVPIDERRSVAETMSPKTPRIN